MDAKNGRAKQYLITTVLSVVLVLVLSGCGGSGTNLTGKWQLTKGFMCAMVQENAPVEFFQDGSVNIGSLSSRYSWADDTHLRIDMAPGVLGCVLEASFQGDQMTLKGNTGDISVLVRK